MFTWNHLTLLASQESPPSHHSVFAILSAKGPAEDGKHGIFGRKTKRGKMWESAGPRAALTVLME